MDIDDLFELRQEHLYWAHYRTITSFLN